MQQNPSQSFRAVLTAKEHGLCGVPVFGVASGEEAVLPQIEHRHRDKYECVLAESGIRTLAAEGVSYTIYPETAFLIHPDETHAADRPTKTSGEILWFQLNAIGPLLSLSEAEEQLLRAKLFSCKTRLFCVPPHVYEMFRESFFLLKKGTPASLLKGRTLFVYALVTLLEAPVAAAVPSPQIDGARQYILTHLHDVIDTDALRMGSNLSNAEFDGQFERELGFPPREYILRMKINAAEKDVAQSDRSLSDIAYDYHFSSFSHFKTTFKRCTGLSPKQYRAKQRKYRR